MVPVTSFNSLTVGSAIRLNMIAVEKPLQDRPFGLLELEAVNDHLVGLSLRHLSQSPRPLQTMPPYSRFAVGRST